MNHWLTSLTLISAVLMTALVPQKAFCGNSEIKGFHLGTCGSQAKSSCLKVDAKSAEGSAVRKIFALKEVQITLLDDTKKPVKNWQADSGYFDSELQRVILFDKNGSGFSERVFDFNDLVGSTKKLREI